MLEKCCSTPLNSARSLSKKYCQRCADVVVSAKLPFWKIKAVHPLGQKTMTIHFPTLCTVWRLQWYGMQSLYLVCLRAQSSDTFKKNAPGMHNKGTNTLICCPSENWMQGFWEVQRTMQTKCLLTASPPLAVPCLNGCLRQWLHWHLGSEKWPPPSRTVFSIPVHNKNTLRKQCVKCLCMNLQALHWPL